MDVPECPNKSSFDELEDELRSLLATFSKGMGVSLFSVEQNNLLAKGVLVAEVLAAEITRWACEDENVSEAGPIWGRVNKMPLIVSVDQDDRLVKSAIDVPSLILANFDGIEPDAEVEFDSELDGNAGKFGQRFWDFVLDHHQGITELFEKDVICHLQYSDRYLKSPLTASLLLQVIKELDMRFPNCYNRTEMTLKLEELRRGSYRSSRAVWDDWQDDRLRENVISAAFEYVDLPINVGIYSRAHMAHSRVLEIKFISGKSVRIRLDEGWGYWETQSGYDSRFDFSSDIRQQGERVAMWSGMLVRRLKRYKTAMVISVRHSD